MPEPSDEGRSLLQLAISLRIAAQRLAESANRMQQAAGHQREQLERLGLLRDRILELLGECRRISDHEPAGPPAAPSPKAAMPPAQPLPRLAPTQHRLPASAFVEFSNWQEFEKFRRMPPITDQELSTCDVEELIRRFSGGSGTSV